MGLFHSSSAEETSAIAASFAKTLKAGAVLAFFGQLGAGKTTFIKALAASITGISPNAVNSPTFQYLNIYHGTLSFYHFDLYRLKNIEEFLEMGFEEFFHHDGVCCIEWSERIDQILPPHTIRISIEHLEDSLRTIHFKGAA